MSAHPAQRFFAIAPRGLEALLAQELTALGASTVWPEHGGVAFAGPLAAGYAANLHSRLASRILWQVAQASYRSEDDLYAAAHALAWEEHLAPHQTLRIDISAVRSPLRSLEFALLRVKDAIVDRLREKTGRRPDIDRVRPDVRVFAFLDAAQLTLYLDLSGEALFKRGWRRDKGEAPLKENLAAGLLQLAGWTPRHPLLDPFCGSGTLLIEAALMATRRAPGLDRPFGLQRLRSFDRALWQRLHEDALAAVKPDAEVLLAGSDISTRVLDTARENTRRAGVGGLLDDARLVFTARDARGAEPLQIVPPFAQGMLVSNPPYGEQSSPRSASVPALMRDVGDRLKAAFSGWQVWLLTSDRDLPRQLRLAESRKPVLYNGALECRFFRFDVVSGPYRPRSSDAGASTSATARGIG
ncbi:MAG: class I SAM-dependent RNA methyltransferase [Burkholderiales bacterium]|nr:class I SAM-dependent RNA methyltransferase [Burkholderiales bacterium]MCA3230510.1 class I SAM-dependent RNA methyltransferase [Burkholderiales bacterium]